MAAFQTLLGRAARRRPTFYKQIRGAADLSTRLTTADHKLLGLAETTG